GESASLLIVERQVLDENGTLEVLRPLAALGLPEDADGYEQFLRNLVAALVTDHVAVAAPERNRMAQLAVGRGLEPVIDAVAVGVLRKVGAPVKVAVVVVGAVVGGDIVENAACEYARRRVV